MTPERSLSFTPASSRVMRWLTDPGPTVPQAIRDVLLAELFSSPGAVLSGMVTLLILNVVAVVLSGGRAFIILLAANLLISTLRIYVIRRAKAAMLGNVTVPTDYCLGIAICWCALQGAIAFVALRSNIAPLQVLASATVMALLGPICARNYPAPRLAILMVMLSDLPFVAGAATCGKLWLLLLVPMTPPYLYGSYLLVRRIQAMSIDTLKARHESQYQARHDPLTGLLNRYGMRALAAANGQTAAPLTLFYLDLDGFKQVNDTGGHAAGDALLQEVARRLKVAVGRGDVVGRMGGDEFVVVAPGMPPAEAEVFAGRLIDAIQTPIDLGQYGTVRVGVSIGFACAPEDSTFVAELYRLADGALYAVKTSAKGTQRRAAEPAPV